VKLWGLEIDGERQPVALRTRAEVQRWAGQRFMGSGDYDRSKRDWPLVSAKVRENHPTARLIRIELK
jgi:hypothetical protein